MGKIEAVGGVTQPRFRNLWEPFKRVDGPRGPRDPPTMLTPFIVLVILWRPVVNTPFSLQFGCATSTERQGFWIQRHQQVELTPASIR